MKEQSLNRFLNKTILVTGAAAGIGEETAKAFCKQGGSVVIADYNELELKRVEQEMSSMPGKVASVKADLTKMDEIKEMIDFAITEFGGLDVLYNNAVSQVSGPITDLTYDAWRYSFTIMVDAVFMASKYAVEHMLEQKKKGVIINAVSPSGLRPDHGMAAYGASKAAIINLTRSIAIDYARFGIRCVGVAPGATLTRSMKNFLGIGDIDPDVKERLGGGMPEEVMVKYRQRLIDACPSGRFAEPVEIANTVLFLASEEASYVNGDTLFADGGMTSQPGGMPRFQP